MSSAGERFNISSQLEHLQLKYPGTGHADVSKHEWLTHQHRDSLASYVGHASLTHYFAIAQNQSVGRVKYQFMQRMQRPCGEEKKEAPLHAALAQQAAANGGAQQQ